MWRFDEAELLEIGKHVADRCRAQIKTRIARERPRPDRLTLFDLPLNQNLQQVLGAFIR
jgi:hypothetical protein